MLTEADLWLAQHLRPEVPRLCFGAGALICSSFVNFRTGAQLKAAIEEGGHASFRSLMLFGFGAAAGCVRTIIFDSASERLRSSMAVQVFAAKLLEEPNEEEQRGTVAAMDSDVALCADLILKIQNVARFTSSIVGGTFAMFRASWKLSAAVWPLLVVGALQGARAGAKRSMKSAQTLAAAREDALAFAEERLQHSDLVRWFCRAEKEANAFHEKCERSVAVAASSARRRGIAHFVLDWASKGVLLGLSSFGSQLVARGELTAGQLTSYFFHAAFLGLGLYGFVGLVPEIMAARAAATRLCTIAKHKALEPQESSSDSSGCLMQYERALPVNFKDVHFRYGHRQEVLQGLSLQLAAGESCALVGASGCGKTTALRILLGDFQVVSGEVSIGGSNVSQLQLKDLRRMVSVSPQAAALLGNSVTEAIEFGAKSKVSADTIQGAAKAASAHSFIKSRPQGYDAPVGRGGELLSGGERQRLALARALVRETPVLLLDEPTSGLDANTAASLAEAVLGRRDRPTTLIATHSLALIRSCDSVAVVSQGRVVQRGRFSELMNDASGALAQIARSGELQEA